MRKTLNLILVLVLVGAFAISVAAKVEHPTTHECWYVSECYDDYCILYKCCEDCVWEKHGYVCTVTCVAVS